MQVTKIVKVATTTLFALALACGSLLAQNRPNRASDFMHIFGSPDVTPFTDSGAATVTLYSTLGPSSTDEYDDTDGYCITGTNQSSCGSSEQWIAQPFTPTKASHATEISVAIQYYAGTNEFEVSLYNDSSDAPGTALKTVQVHNAPAAGTCCTLVNASLGTPGVSLTAGTQYWVVVNTNTTGATFSGYWAFANAFVSYNPAGAGWTTFDDPYGNEATSVRGTIP